MAVYAKLVEVELLGRKPQDFDERKLVAEGVEKRRETPEKRGFEIYGIFFAMRGDTVKICRGGYGSLSPTILDSLAKVEVVEIRQ